MPEEARQFRAGNSPFSKLVNTATHGCVRGALFLAVVVWFGCWGCVRVALGSVRGVAGLPLLPKRRGDRVLPLGPRGPWSFGGGGHVWGAWAIRVGSLRASLVTLLVVVGCLMCGYADVAQGSRAGVEFGCWLLFEVAWVGLQFPGLSLRPAWAEQHEARGEKQQGFWDLGSL